MRQRCYANWNLSRERIEKLSERRRSHSGSERWPSAECASAWAAPPMLMHWSLTGVTPAFPRRRALRAVGGEAGVVAKPPCARDSPSLRCEEYNRRLVVIYGVLQPRKTTAKRPSRPRGFLASGREVVSARRVAGCHARSGGTTCRTMIVSRPAVPHRK